MIVIGVGGLARAGKDSFCKIASSILEKNGYRTKTYRFADAIKRELAPFLREMCGADVWSEDEEIKKDMRDLMVWYGTTWWRKRDPEHWIKNVDAELILDNQKYDVAFISDVRYPNEAVWIRHRGGYNTGGWLVHVRSYKLLGMGQTKLYEDAPNEQERINDPEIMSQAQHQLDWEKRGVRLDDVHNDTYLINKVNLCLKTCPFLTIRIP